MTTTKESLIFLRDSNSRSSNSAKTGTPAVPVRPLRPASASLIQNPSRSYDTNQSSLSDAANNYETRASRTVSDTSYALHRPFLTEESSFFRRSHTASSETARPSSSLSLNGSGASDIVSPMSFGEPLMKPSSALDCIRPMSSLSASQFEREVCKCFLKFFLTKSLPPFNITNCFRCASQSRKICNALENRTSRLKNLG